MDTLVTVCAGIVRVTGSTIETTVDSSVVSSMDVTVDAGSVNVSMTSFRLYTVVIKVVAWSARLVSVVVTGSAVKVMVERRVVC